MYWAVMAIGALSSSWVFYPNENHSAGLAIMYLINMAVMMLSSIFMVIALLKMRKLLTQKGLGDQISPLRMVVHALAFLLYVAIFFIASLTEWITDTNIVESYATWFICTIFGFCSFVCLFHVLWHLGTK